MRSSRARDQGFYRGTGDTGRHNAITDVPGVRVGHATIAEPPPVHSGVSVIGIGDVNPNAPLPAGLSVANGYGKLIGATQLAELGRIEAPIVLTSTLSAFTAADAMVTWMLQRQDCAHVRSFNPVVGECNDSVLSDIRARPVSTEHVLRALTDVAGGPVAEGSVGAGTGLIALGFKAGIGTASRVVGLQGHPVTVGVLVQANFGGVLRLAGREVPAPQRVADGDRDGGAAGAAGEEGSCMIIVVTDAALDARQLNRLAARAAFGLGRVGASYSHGSGDYAIAASTRGTPDPPPDHALDPLFTGVLDATEESVLNALSAAVPVTTAEGRRIPALSDVAGVASPDIGAAR